MTLMDIVCESLKPLGDTESQAQFAESVAFIIHPVALDFTWRYSIQCDNGPSSGDSGATDFKCNTIPSSALPLALSLMSPVGSCPARCAQPLPQPCGAQPLSKSLHKLLVFAERR